MSISVLIPAFNCSRTIQATVDSVLAQTVPADEVLVMDDGSTDNTRALLDSYGSRVTVFHQDNQGVAAARNALVRKASGDLIAFLDHDDIWHCKYLEVQSKIFQEHPEAVAFFTWHVNFNGYGSFDWSTTEAETGVSPELIQPIDFLMRYNKTTGFFASMSYCCVPRTIFSALNGDPFHEELAGVDDSYLFTMLPLVGPVVYFPCPLVAYRGTNDSQSRNRLKMFQRWVEVFSKLDSQYRAKATPEMIRVFRRAAASKRRGYAKLLIDAGRVSDARKQLTRSIRSSINLVSVAKSLALLSFTYAPRVKLLKWTAKFRC